LTAAPPDLTVPAFRTMWRGALRLSAIGCRIPPNCKELVNAVPAAGGCRFGPSAG
jgi:hypothetical protein